ncbi:MAG: hypothetical protein U1E27_09720 [Kiritimatiellia bacterium]|nr:hypothetical protein [Kiritimatiellia bacterium]
MIAVQGIGWMTESACGQIRAGRTFPLDESLSLGARARQEGWFRYPVKNFGRFDAPTQKICCLTALALADAGIEYAEGKKADVGLMGTRPLGCLEAHERFFRDYIEGGRSLSRANLFIYTLPSSPLAEAAVHFGLQGPLMFVQTPRNPLASLVTLATGMIRRGEAGRMLVFRLDEGPDLCLVLGPSDSASDSGSDGPRVPQQLENLTQ